MENHADDIKALFESMMDKDYGFYDYTGTGDYIEGALGGYQYDADHLGAGRAMAEGQGPADDRPQQPWYLAVNFVNPHDVMWVNTDLPGEPVQAKDAQLKIAGRARTTRSTGRNGTSVPAAEHLAAAARRAGPRARPSHLSRGQRLPDGADPQRGMARRASARTTTSTPSATSTSRSSRSSTSSTGWV